MVFKKGGGICRVSSSKVRDRKLQWQTVVSESGREKWFESEPFWSVVAANSRHLDQRSRRVRFYNESWALQNRILQ